MLLYGRVVQREQVRRNADLGDASPPLFRVRQVKDDLFRSEIAVLEPGDEIFCQLVQMLLPYVRDTRGKRRKETELKCLWAEGVVARAFVGGCCAKEVLQGSPDCLS